MLSAAVHRSRPAGRNVHRPRLRAGRLLRRAAPPGLRRRRALARRVHRRRRRARDRRRPAGRACSSPASGSLSRWAGSDATAGADDVVIGSSFAWILGPGRAFPDDLHDVSASSRPVARRVSACSSGRSSGCRRARRSGAVHRVGRRGRRASPSPGRCCSRPSTSRWRPPAGCPSGCSAIGFLVLLGVTAAEATQAVGSLLLLGLLAAPAGAAQSLDRPSLSRPLAFGPLAVASIWLGLALAYAAPSLPPSFAIMAVATAAYVAALARRRFVSGGNNSISADAAQIRAPIATSSTAGARAAES